jgi:dihydrofolate reductase
MSTIALIVAMGTNRVIGRENRLPWRMPADMKRFREVTMGKAVIMGRETYESIGQPLDGRHNIVLTRDRQYDAEGCSLAHSIEAAIQLAGVGEIIVIGGARVYEQMLPLAGRIYLTLIDAAFEGDTYFPPILKGAWQTVSREIYAADEKNPHNYAFLVLERQAPGD